MRLRWLSSIIFSAAVATTASAGVIGPSRVSTLVNASAFFTSCITKGLKAFDLSTTADGRNVQFIIPAKSAFVATVLTAEVVDLAEGEIAEVFIRIEDETGGTSNALISAYTAPANAAGVGTTSLALPSGAAFTPSAASKICVGASAGTFFSATMNGYFAPAK